MLHSAYDELRLRNVHVMREHPEVQHRECGGNDHQAYEQPVETHGAGGEPAGTRGEPAGAVFGVTFNEGVQAGFSMNSGPCYVAREAKIRSVAESLCSGASEACSSAAAGCVCMAREA